MGGNSSKESNPDAQPETTIVDSGIKSKTTKKGNFNNFGNRKTQANPSTLPDNFSYSTIVVPESTIISSPTPTTISRTVSKTTKSKSSKATATGINKHSEPDDGSSGSWKLYGGIALGLILIIIIFALLVKKNKKSKKNDTIPLYQNENKNQTLKPEPPKMSNSELYSGPIYDPSKESDYSTINYSNTVPSMGVATSVEAATLQRKKDEMDAAAAAYSHATLPNFNSSHKEQSMSDASLPQTSMAQTYNYGQQSFDLNNSGSYDQYNQAQPTFDTSYNQPAYDPTGNQPTYNPVANPVANQPTYNPVANPVANQPAYSPTGFNQPQTNYDVAGFNQPQSFDNNGYNNVAGSPYGVQYANNYTPGVSSVDQNVVTSPLSLPISPAGGVIVSANYSSSQTTSIKQSDGTITETIDYSTNSLYEVDKDYVAIYSYEPALPDELCINVNDRIHLLEIYSDGWGYGKNVTTAQLGILPLNRLKVEEEEKTREVPKEKKIKPADISKRTVSMKVKKPKKSDKQDDDDERDNRRERIEEYNRRKQEEDEREKRRERSDEYNRKKQDDDDEYERRRERRRYDDDDEYERRRERRRYDDDDEYERRKERRRERRRHDDDDDYERRDRRRHDDSDDDYERRDRRRHDDSDDDYERRDRRRYDDSDDDNERRKERRRYSDDDYDKKERRRREDSEDRDIEKKSYEDKESKKSNEDDSKKSKDNGIVEYEIKSYRRDN